MWKVDYKLPFQNKVIGVIMQHLFADRNATFTTVFALVKCRVTGHRLCSNCYPRSWLAKNKGEAF